MGFNKYQKIWMRENGEIPKTGDNRIYHIHHIDGNRKNNDISNLLCVSPYEHFLIHLNNKEYMSAHAIYIKYLNETEKEKHKDVSKLAANQRDNSNIGFNNPETYKKIFDKQNERIRNGEFHLQSGKIQSETNKKRVALGIHNFQQQKSKDAVKQRNTQMLQNKTHPFLNEENRSDWALKYKTCQYCGYIGRGVGFLYNHDMFCIENKFNRRETCLVCNAKLHPSIIKRYHNEKCKHNKPSTTSRKT